MEYSLFDDAPLTKVFHDDSLQKLRCHTRVPDCVRIHDDDRATSANSEAWGFSPLDPRRPKQESLALE